jgi:hypothetical protein
MSFTKPEFPPVDPETFLAKPLMERMRFLTQHWTDNGFGSPRMVHAIYIAKLVLLFSLGGVFVATVTSGLPAFWHITGWWNQPIVYQKAVLWTVLLEAIGIAGSWGPLAGKVKPMTGGILFWLRSGTIRLRPWKWVPFTDGDRRTWFDGILYFALLISLAVPLLAPGVHSDSLSQALPHNTSGLVNPALLVAPIALLVLNGLRDKTIFLAARGEQYLPALVFFAVLPFVDMIIALKLLIVVVWVGAGVSKFGKHFANVIPPMVSNSPCMPFKAVKRAHYRDFPRDLRPSRAAHFMAHVLGTTVEIAAPAGAVVLDQQRVDGGGRDPHGRLPPVHRLDVPTGRTAGMERAVRLRVDLLVPRLPGLAGIRRVEHVVAVADGDDRGGAGFLPDPGQFPARQGVVSAIDAPVRRQLALGGMGLRPRGGVEAEQDHAQRPQPDRPVHRLRIRTAVGRGHDAAHHRLAHHAQPGPWPVLRVVENVAGHRHSRGA